MRGRKDVHTLLVVLLVVVAVTVASIVAVVYRQVSSELRTQARAGVENRIASLREGVVNHLENLAVSLRAIMLAFDGRRDARRQVESSVSNFVVAHPNVRKCFVAYPGMQAYLAAGTTRADAEAQLDLVRRARVGDLSGVGSPFRDAKGWFIGPAFRDAIGLSTQIPIVVYELPAAGEIAVGVVVADLTELLFSLGGELSLDVEDATYPISVAVFDDAGRLLETTRNNPLLVEPAIVQHKSFVTETVRPHDGQRIETRSRDERTGLWLSGSVAASPVISRAARLSAQILMIGAVCIVFILALGLALLRTVDRLQVMERQRSDIRVRSLQATMNPHFLFNSLDTIVGLASQVDHRPLHRALRALSTQLHAAVRDKNDLITVAGELRYLDSYMTIQKYRYVDEFDFSMQVGSGCAVVRIPRFCLQPVLENCFSHALPKTVGTLRIQLTVECSADAVEVTVSDNGPGCSDERWSEVRNGLSERDLSAAEGVGLYGVHQHLVLSYGKRFGLRRLPSETGFTIQVVLPALRQ